MYNENIGIGSASHSMNNNTDGRKKKNKKKKDFSLDNKMPKQQNTTTKADIVDMSTGIIAIEETPDVATWNKKSQIKEYAAGIIVNRSGCPETRPPTTTGIGLRDKKQSKKDLIIDPANKKEVEEAIKSGSTLTDEANDLS
jgi:hypothetical protein